MISCRALGPVTVVVDGEPAPPELLWRKNLALLIYLARSPKRTRARDHLIGLLWADKSEQAARHSLREAVRVLRRCAGEDAVATTGDQVQLDAGAVTLDLDQFDALVAQGEWARAAELVAGDFLEGFSVPDASGFEDWLAAERLACRHRSVDAMVRYAEERIQSGDVGSATRLGMRASELDPLSERALRAAMRGLALAGDRAGALSCYQAFADRLKEAAAAEPTAELVALAERVRQERSWRVPEHLTRRPAVGAESRRAPLIGREAQLRQLLGTWAGVKARRRLALAVVASDPGQGKSRLLEELLARARLDGAVVATTTAVAADREQPNSGILGLARGGLMDGPGVAGAQPAALAAFAAQLPEWADRFGAKGGVEPQPLGRALSEVARAIAEEGPLVLAADDGHQLDAASLTALSGLARDLAGLPLLLLLLTEPHAERPELDALWSRVGRDVEGVTVRLGPLEPRALRQLAQWALPQYDEAELDRLTRRVAADSAGLPLLAVELLHAVALGLDLKAVTGAWPQPLRTLEQTLPGDLPDAVVAAIRVGFRRLSEPAQRALAAAAVLGERVPAQAIGRGTGLEGDALHQALDELEWQRWLTADARGYGFVARIVRDVIARDMVSPGQRQRVLAAAS